MALAEELRSESTSAYDELSLRLDAFSQTLGEVEAKAAKLTDLSVLAITVQSMEHVQVTQQQQLSHRIEALGDRLQRFSEQMATPIRNARLSREPTKVETVIIESIDVLQQQVQTVAKHITQSELLSPRVDLLEDLVKAIIHKLEAAAGAQLVPKLMRVQNQVQQISVRLEEETRKQTRLDSELMQFKLRSTQGDWSSMNDSLELVAEVGSLQRSMAAGGNAAASGALSENARWQNLFSDIDRDKRMRIYTASTPVTDRTSASRIEVALRCLTR
jgi:vancomycin resistance protein YoaR